MRILSINLSKIPADKIKKIRLKDGSTNMFVDIVIADRNKPDQFGNDVTSWVSQTKEEREAKTKPAYIGNGKKYVAEVLKENENPFAATHEFNTPAPAAATETPTDKAPF